MDCTIMGFEQKKFLLAWFLEFVCESKNQSLLFYRGLVQENFLNLWDDKTQRLPCWLWSKAEKRVVLKGWRDWLQDPWKQLCQWLPVCSIQARYRGKAWHVTFRNLSQTKSLFKLPPYLHAHQHSNCRPLKCMIYIIQNRLGCFEELQTAKVPSEAANTLH